MTESLRKLFGKSVALILTWVLLAVLATPGVLIWWVLTATHYPAIIAAAGGCMATASMVMNTMDRFEQVATEGETKTR